MIRMKVIKVNTDIASSTASNYKLLKADEVAKVEESIAQIGYENIKNIIVSAPGSSYSCYSIFYEDGQPFNPYVEDQPKKKGFFG